METNYNCVLLIDDDETSLFLSDKVLVKSGLADHTHAALNGERALDFLEEQSVIDLELVEHWPELILLDINMPIMDGFDFLDVWKEKAPFDKQPPKVVILTSSNNPRDLERAKGYAIHGYLNKPLTKDKLLSLN